MSIKKSSIQQALIEAREIEKSALDNAKKALEEEMAPRIKQVANDVLKELEQEALKEDITIKISTDGETIETPEITNSEEINNEIPSDSESTSDEEIKNDEENMEDIFEIEGLEEADETQPLAEPTPAPAPTAELPAPTETPEAGTPTEAPSIETVNQKLDDVLAKLDTLSAEESKEAEGATGEGEGDVSIIEDEPETPAAETAAPAPTPAPAPSLQEDEYELDESSDEEEEEVVYEMEDEGMEDEGVVYEFEEEEEEADLNELNADSIMELFNEIGETDEIQVVDEDKEEEEEEEEGKMEEDSQVIRRRAGQRGKIGEIPLGKHAPHSDIATLKESIDNIKAQYGSKVDELTQENESLKQTIKEYKESFIVLRKQINEVQIFNAKLAYANKLFTNGGLTKDEKMKIAEDFDKIETIEEAKKLYNTLLSEMKVSKSPKTSVDKLKSASPAVIANSNSQTLFESDEMRRMKRLAGIGKKNEE